MYIREPCQPAISSVVRKPRPKTSAATPNPARLPCRAAMDLYLRNSASIATFARLTLRMGMSCSCVYSACACQPGREINSPWEGEVPTCLITSDGSVLSPGRPEELH